MVAKVAQTWKQQPVPPIVEAWMDTLMSPEWSHLVQSMGSKHIDFTLFWCGDRPPKKPEVRIS